MNIAYRNLIQLAETYSDIKEHLCTLLVYSMDCEHITEMGVRSVVSTWAFLAAKPKKLICIDIEDCPIKPALDAADEIGVDMTFLKQDTIAPDFEIEETDFLFIDTLHVYEQLKRELKKHGNKARKYLAFHDTTTFGYRNESDIFTHPYEGLRPAIAEFLEENPHWIMCNVYENNNGLTILRRQSTDPTHVSN